MQDFSHVLSECEEINSLLHKPINSTQRIKYTCFNVSANYIILGSTSGSIYLFNRQPCAFQQLIPLSEGTVSWVTISPDERTIALATTRGSVCLVALKPHMKLIAVSTEHVSEQVTYICWNDNSSEVYIGDGVGKVSVMVLSIFTVNGMFQARACTLMNLDSSIVQLNYLSPLLLVSTLTRCYICNTIQEQYKQIGNKARNGEFGACFLKALKTNDRTLTVHNDDMAGNASTKGLFSFIPEADNNELKVNNSTIFCARPGSRLWEVSANGEVVKTHQFKEALAIPPTQIFNPSAKPKRNGEQLWQSQSLPFPHLHVIGQKYLFSHTNNGLYILDPVSSTVLLWSNEFQNIASAKVVENKIYLMTTDSEFHSLSLSSVDILVLRLYNEKRYKECLDACILYKRQLLKCIPLEEINEVSDLENSSHSNDEISTKLLPLMSLLRTNITSRPIKLDSGIVVVNDGSLMKANVPPVNSIKIDKLNNDTTDYDDSITFNQVNKSENYIDYTPNANTVVIDVNSETMQNKGDDNYELTIDDNSMKHLSIESETANEVKTNFNSYEDATRKVQSDLEPVYVWINDIKPSMKESELEQAILQIENRLNDIKASYEKLTELKSFMYEIIRTAELYYYNTFLENAPMQLANCSDSEIVTKQFLNAFVEVNSRNYAKCSCDFPHPTAQVREPKFLGIGRALLRNFTNGASTEQCISLCTKVPYLWREYLSSYIRQRHALCDILRQCLQTKDSFVLSMLMPLLEASEWKEIAKYMNEIEEGKCLSCGKTIIVNDLGTIGSVDWNDVTREIMKRDGPDAAMTFLTKLESAIPNISLDKSIVQSMVFTKILYHHGLKRMVDFDKSSPETSEYSTMCSAKVRDQLAKVLEKDLGRPIDKNIFGTGAYHWGMRYQAKSSNCPCCTLSLQTPVLLGDSGIAIFPCGHAYHVSCMIERKLTKCNLHSL